MTVTAEQTSERTGRLVAGRYQLRALLGRGGMGRVWLAEDELLHRQVAIKQIALRGPAAENARTAAATALNEARAAARINHVGAVRVHDLADDGGEPWIVMELLSGRTLAEALDADGPLPPAEVARIGRCLLDVLEAVHRAGLVHCDVKPANVQLCDDGRVMLTDFGIACPVDTDEPVALAGSPAYMAPERARGGAIEPASDLFSLGATLFTAVEGRSPFAKGEVFATLVAVVEDSPGPFRNAGPLRPAIEGLLAKKPRSRLTADQARDLLGHLPSA